MRAADEQVAAPPEAVDDPVEIALALAVALVVGDARVAAVRVADDRQPGKADGTARRAPLPFVAQHKAPPDVEVPIEPEPLVERPTLDEVGAAEGLEIALDGVDVARRRVLELAQVRRDDPPPAGDRDRDVIEGTDQRRHDVAGRFDARVEQDDDGTGRPAHADVRRGGMAEALARPDDLSGEPRSRGRDQDLERRALCVGWPIRDDHDRRPIRCTGPQAGERPREIVGPVRGDQHDRRDGGRRFVKPRRHAAARAVADPVALGDIGRRGGRQPEVGASIGDLPAGRLDLGARSRSASAQSPAARAPARAWAAESTSSGIRCRGTPAG